MTSLYSLIDISFDKDKVTLPYNIYTACRQFEEDFLKSRLPTMLSWYEPGEEPRLNGPIPEKVATYYQCLVVYEGNDRGLRTACWSETGGPYDWPTLFHITIGWQPLRGSGPVSEYSPSSRIPLGSFKTHDYGLTDDMTHNAIFARRASKLITQADGDEE